ncbi:tail fiber domain-containing protein [Gluconobacter kondonii]|uniref:tail fiber domain-containing protein n=1 Tax=Gluconobacter kondonii TaxID=941463 RepID=UPI001B8B97DD|nr:tail fiber domain-containing protein [Gluconobacter kondonii]MBS1056105.1 tail fiber domain-containing protein [Gluconobacter kondonii]
MTNTYGAPTGLDLSGCTVTATGGATAQTLADLGKAVSDAGTAAATATSDASSAIESVADVTKTANSALQPSQAGVAGGYVAIATDSSVTIPAPATGGNSNLYIGDKGDQSEGWGYAYFKVGLGTAPMVLNGFAPGTFGTSTSEGGGLMIAGSFLPSQGLGASTLGNASAYWNGITSQTAVDVVSDLNDKTVVGELGSTSYTDLTTKLRAVWATISGYVYTLKSGASGRQHVGVIAQYVAAAFQAQGLNAADFGLWCSTPKTTTTKNADGTVTITPVYEADGKTQATQETIRYAELLSLGLFCEKLERADLTTRITALEAKAST